MRRPHFSLDPDGVAADFMEDGEPLLRDDNEDNVKVLGLYSTRRLG
ncbi:hypothetical protein [Streptomyces sp. NPDC127066]